MAVLALDHLVYGVPDLDAAVEIIARRWGVQPTPGGRHEGLGTANYLVSLGPHSYLEIIGPDREAPDPEQPRPFGVSPFRQPRLLGWAVQVAEIDEVVKESRRVGYDPGPIRPMSRHRPDGSRLQWRLAVPAGGRLAYGGTVPFVIDWGTSHHPARDLPAGCKLLSLDVEHPNSEEALGAIEALGALDALGSRLEVMTARFSRLRARISTPKGKVILR
ncbi:MAG: VOC family protein [Deltaproteobacteria bacterium]|nr:VOC family protein [Deltaproteobacteria bacterium]